MHRPLHPSLIRIYSEASAESLYFDETYSTSQESFSQSFYFLTAVQLRHADLPAIRQALVETAAAQYWHATEALQSDVDRQRAKNLLSHCQEWIDPTFISCKTALSPEQALEDARRDCMRALLSHAVPQIPQLSGLIFEARRENNDNYRDRRFIKALRRQRVVPHGVHFAWVSPAEEQTLWLLDLVRRGFPPKQNPCGPDCELIRRICREIHNSTRNLSWPPPASSLQWGPNRCTLPVGRFHAIWRGMLCCDWQGLAVVRLQE